MKLIATITTIFLAGVLLTACKNDSKKQETDLLDSILKMHDKVMNEQETVEQNKIKIDSLVDKKKAPSSDQGFQVSQELDHADEAMENWMHQFNADYTGKSHEQIMQYLSDQKKKLTTVDQQLETAVKNSNTYLSTVKK